VAICHSQRSEGQGFDAVFRWLFVEGPGGASPQKQANRAKPGDAQAAQVGHRDSGTASPPWSQRSQQRKGGLDLALRSLAQDVARQPIRRAWVSGGGVASRPSPPDGGVRPPNVRCLLGEVTTLILTRTSILRIQRPITNGYDQLGCWGLRFGQPPIFRVTRKWRPLLAPPMKILEHGPGNFSSPVS